MTDLTTQIPQKPEKPKSDECCGSGNCYSCVWDEYREKLATWKLTNLQTKTKKQDAI
ncbi:oxidoreductase-like domain-containing protein [Pseudoalteromonas sp. S554]|uniref:oxidoreductase-like domain-containing protein n=1 Tax=Pseudoalteromonas sp. S554 TaxID=2066516 RepID=UPI00110CC361|nr:oxidoreductase-like domain-containing protein [Pseudoalteromonas sp. S554]TMS83383.1 hypothetical protein CWB65_00750 [Pseudoalteromonas sp. S554]